MVTLPLDAGVDDSALEATIDFPPAADVSSQQAQAAEPPVAPEAEFLEPSRGEGELGWLAHYRVRKLIGVGGMGLVYLAEDSHLARPVALKVMRRELATSSNAALRFTREARAAAAIKHDNVVTIYQVGEARGVAFLAMEYLQGISLQRWLDRGRKPSADLSLRIGREIASGLVAAHRLGLIHRDIKPANIWLEAPSGRVKILDFGQARAEREDVQITQSGTIMGTPAFMSPEQAAGEASSPASDLFSLGCVLYRLCCARLPFQGNTILALLTALASQTPPTPIDLNPDIPVGLSTLIARLLEKQPADRPASAQAVFDTIRTIERQLQAQRQAVDIAPSPAITALMGVVPEETRTVLRRTPKPASPPPPDPPPRKKQFAVVGAVGLLLALGVGVGVRLNRGRGDVAATGTQGPSIAQDPAEPVKPPEGNVVASTPPTEVSAPPLPPPAPPAVAPVPVTPVPVAVVPSVPQLPTAVKPDAKDTEVPELRGEKLWGTFLDPTGDCRLEIDESQGTATLKIPGTTHVMSAEFGKNNAPSTQRLVSGDFRSSVHVLGTEKVGGRITTKEFPPYHGGGLLVWQDASNYVRFEIATDITKGKQRHYANFEYRQNARLVSSKGQLADSGSAQLRLERKADVITAFFSTDGKKWVSFAALKVALPQDVSVGIVGINTSSKPVELEFREFQLRSEPQAAGSKQRPLIVPEPTPIAPRLPNGAGVMSKSVVD